MVFFFYRVAVGLMFYCALPFLLAFVVITGKHRQGLCQRFGFYPATFSKKKGGKTVWIHASSVGEVQAAYAVFAELMKHYPDASYLVSTMTLTGLEVANKHFGKEVNCILAPLDIPFVVEKAVRTIRPDLYICLETELWPLLIQSLSLRKVKICMINGRISERSYQSYKRLRPLIRHLLGKYNRISAISQKDRDRYVSLGADSANISVLGNIKYDFQIPDNSEAIKKYYHTLISTEEDRVFIAGSTHTGEEELLLSLYNKVGKHYRFIFIIAPRHIERIPELEKICIAGKIEYQLLSDLKNGADRGKNVILVDTMGELAQIYSIADFIFCGGSLVEKGGHNVMEAAVWQKVVFWGPHMDDFEDAADILGSEKGGFCISSVDELQDRLVHFLTDPEEYYLACKRAGEAVRRQQGGAEKQVAYILG